MNYNMWGLTSLIFAISTNTFAQSAASRGSTSTATRPSAQTEWIKQRLSVGGFISNASSLSAGGVGLSSTTPGGKSEQGSLDANSETSLGLQAQITNFVDPNWGWFAGASIEQDREITSFRIASGNQTGTVRFNNRPHFLPVIVSGGAAYRFNDKIYAVAGLNYTLFKDFGSGDLRGASLDPKLGYQYGIGFKPTERVSLELVQRQVNYDLSGTVSTLRINAADLSMSGLSLTARYSIQ